MVCACFPNKATLRPEHELGLDGRFPEFEQRCDAGAVLASPHRDLGSQPSAAQPLRFALTVRTDSGPQYLEVSEDLVNWTRLGLVNGPEEIVDGTSALNSTRFYRVLPGSDDTANL